MENNSTIFDILPMNDSTWLYTFKTDNMLDYKPCQTIKLNNKYELTPISPPNQSGSFQILSISKLDGLNIGDNVKYTLSTRKYQMPFTTQKINILVSTVGIFNVYQMLYYVCKQTDVKYEITVLYSSKKDRKIIMKDELDRIVLNSFHNIKIVYYNNNIHSSDVLQRDITQLSISTHCFPPGDDVLTIVSGDSTFYSYICGDRLDPTVTKILGKLGYDEDNVYKF